MVTRQGAPGAAHETRQQDELGRRERHILAGSVSHAVAIEVEHQTGESQPLPLLPIFDAVVVLRRLRADSHRR